MNHMNPEVLRLSQLHQVSVGQAHAMWLADPQRKPWITADRSDDVECTQCGLWHHMDDDCPPPFPRAYREED